MGVVKNEMNALDLLTMDWMFLNPLMISVPLMIGYTIRIGPNLITWRLAPKIIKSYTQTTFRLQNENRNDH